MEQKNRILWIDFTKTIVMFLVIIGHSSIPSLFRGAIYSFHMPLFFLLSGYMTKCSETKQQVLRRIRKTIKSLLITAYLIWATRLIIYLVIDRVNCSLLQIILSAIWAGGEDYTIAGVNIPAMGMTWFLVTLFILRNAYDILHYLTSGLHMTIISAYVVILGMIIGHWIQLPFSFDLALFSFAFYHFGQLLRHKSIRSSAIKCVAVAVLWGGLLLVEYIICDTYLGMTSRRYPIFCLTCALAGCMLCIYICQFLCKILPSSLLQPIYMIGQHLILLFVVHYMDGIWYPIIKGNLNMYLSVLIRLLVDVFLFFTVLSIRNYFQRKIENLNSTT